MDQIEEVLSGIDIVELINSYVPLKKAGRNFKACCPFHSEKTPSFIVSSELQIYKCFGCGQGGNAIKFLQEYEKMDFGEALRFLAEKAGVKLRDYRPDKNQLVKDRLLEINHLASEYYHYILTSHPAGKPALVYLRSRGINNQSIKSFKLGFAPVGWENLANFLIRKKGYKSEEVVQTGLIIRRQASSVKQHDYYDRFRERIVFPIFDHRGNIVGFSGRVISEGIEGSEGFGGAKYINTPETLLYHKSQSLYGLLQSKEVIKKADGVVLVEGEFDVISSHQIGVKNITAIKGSALTREQVELLSRFTRNFYFCLDADSAGEEASKRGILLAEGADINIRVVVLPVGKDADECVRTDPSSWQKAVKKTIPVYDFYLHSAVNRFSVGTGEAKKRISESVLPLLNKITNEVMKVHYFKKTADLLEIPYESVVKEAQRQFKETKIQYLPRTAKKEKPRPRKEILEEYLLALVFHSPDDYSELLGQYRPEYLTTPAVKRIFKFLLEYQKNNPKELQVGKFAKMIPEELRETVNRVFLSDFSDLQDSGKIKKEWQKVCLEIEKIELHDKLGRLKAVLGDKSKSRQEKKQAEQKIMEIAKKL